MVFKESGKGILGAFFFFIILDLYRVFPVSPFLWILDREIDQSGPVVGLRGEELEDPNYVVNDMKKIARLKIKKIGK